MPVFPLTIDRGVNRNGVRRKPMKIAAYLCGVPVSKSELLGYANTGKLPFRAIEIGGLLAPGLDFNMEKFHVKETMQSGRLSWGIFERETGARVASFLPGFPRAVATIKDLFDAALDNERQFRSGRVEKLSARQLRDMLDGDVHLPETRMARTKVPPLETIRRF